MTQKQMLNCVVKHLSCVSNDPPTLHTIFFALRLIDRLMSVLAHLFPPYIDLRIMRWLHGSPILCMIYSCASFPFRFTRNSNYRSNEKHFVPLRLKRAVQFLRNIEANDSSLGSISSISNKKKRNKKTELNKNSLYEPLEFACNRCNDERSTWYNFNSKSHLILHNGSQLRNESSWNPYNDIKASYQSYVCALSAHDFPLSP